MDIVLSVADCLRSVEDSSAMAVRTEAMPTSFNSGWILLSDLIQKVLEEALP